MLRDLVAQAFLSAQLFNSWTRQPQQYAFLYPISCYARYPCDTGPDALRAVETYAGATSGKYIVKFKEGVSPKAWAKRLGLSNAVDWNIINDLGSNLDTDSLSSLRASADVELISEDGIMHTMAIQEDAPWGLSRLSSLTPPAIQNADLLNFTYIYDAAAGEGVDIYIVDTGVYVHHGDFEDRARWGIAVGSYQQFDGHGHGTHVAGSAAGKQFGVAKATKTGIPAPPVAYPPFPIRASIVGLTYERGSYQSLPSTRRVTQCSLVHRAGCMRASLPMSVHRPTASLLYISSRAEHRVSILGPRLCRRPLHGPQAYLEAHPAIIQWARVITEVPERWRAGGSFHFYEGGRSSRWTSLLAAGKKGRPHPWSGGYYEYLPSAYLVAQHTLGMTLGGLHASLSSCVCPSHHVLLTHLLFSRVEPRVSIRDALPLLAMPTAPTSGASRGPSAGQTSVVFIGMGSRYY
ncbi:unnamed protein product [Cyclocybe aegerita]|uniref:Uncharacterized protein n=1 Tax=Cyclocybe aegerita TaxID=1973307 RepID=A0A8S0VZ27_CYCAE|nr:unnamed protein product [Cyclocybe aegerita]